MKSENLSASSDTLGLLSGSLELLLAPGLGGSIARFEYAGDGARRPILRGAEEGARTVLDQASFPLVPFCNRIRDGRFHFRGREVRIECNLPRDPSPLHGQGWLAAWEVGTATASTAELVFRHPPGEWPWSYEARQRFELDAGGLTLRLGCRNLSDEPMPCGLGQHPYFPCDETTRLDTRVASAWTIDDKVLPVEEVPAAGRYDLTDRPVCGQDLDNGFGGWGGLARIGSPRLPFEIEMSSPDAGFFQLYSPVDGGLFVAEPVTHANAALNEPEDRWGELGMRVLAPGEEMALEMRLDVRPLNNRE